MRPRNAKHFFLLFLAAISFASTGGARAQGTGSFLMGADASYIDKMESHGTTYKTSGGSKSDFFSILSGYKNSSGQGVDLIRLRIWNNPGDGGWDNLNDMLYMAKRAHNAGMSILLDFHYSDTWADAGHQTPPAAWANYTGVQYQQAIYNWSNSVVAQMISQGTPPAYIQVGNEITDGMLWPYGEVGGSNNTPTQWANLGGLLKSAIKGIKATGSTAKIIVHIDNGGSGDAVGRWFFDAIAAQGVSFSIIGLSYYYFFHGPLSNLTYEITDLTSRYSKPVMVMETSYPWTLQNFDSEGNVVSASSQSASGYTATQAGQQSYFQATVAAAKNAGAAGILYWGGEWLGNPGGSSYDNQTLFDNNGITLPVLTVFTSR